MYKCKFLIIFCLIFILNLASCCTLFVNESLRVYDRKNNVDKIIYKDIKVEKKFKNLDDSQIHIGEYLEKGRPSEKYEEDFHAVKFEEVIDSWKSDLLVYVNENYPVEWFNTSWGEKPSSPVAFLFIRNLDIAKSITPDNYSNYIKTDRIVKLPLIIIDITPIENSQLQIYSKMFYLDENQNYKVIENKVIKNNSFMQEERKEDYRIKPGSGPKVVHAILHIKYLLAVPLDIAFSPFYLIFWATGGFDGGIRF